MVKCNPSLTDEPPTSKPLAAAVGKLPVRLLPYLKIFSIFDCF